MSKDRYEDSPESTGPGVGTVDTGVLAGGGAMGGTADLRSDLPSSGSRDTDTGLEFGPGQSTSTGTLPTQGSSNLDGTDPDGNLQTDSRYGDRAPIGHINEYGDTRSEEDRAERQQE